MNKNARYIWIDNVKIIAIALVAVGHMLMGLFDAGILNESNYPQGFVNAIYLFHVQLFFICSGFLYQRLTQTQDFKAYSKNILKKLIAFGIPYFVFETATYALKVIFSGSVNVGAQTSLFNRLFLYPFAPYWFLYALFLMFLISPIIKNKIDAAVRIAVAAALFLICATGAFNGLPRFFKLIAVYVSDGLIWFVLGMALAFFKIDKAFKKSGGILFILFVVLFVLKTKLGVKFIGDSLILGLLACGGIVTFIGSFKGEKSPKALAFAAKYIMPVFLMHTIFAAAIRSVLLHFGITSLALHLVCGITASFALPVIAGLIMEKLKLDFLYQPTKYIKIK